MPDTPPPCLELRPNNRAAKVGTGLELRAGPENAFLQSGARSNFGIRANDIQASQRRTRVNLRGGINRRQMRLVHQIAVRGQVGLATAQVPPAAFIHDDCADTKTLLDQLQENRDHRLLLAWDQAIKKDGMHQIDAGERVRDLVAGAQLVTNVRYQTALGIETNVKGGD